jgi:hypothetical protein
MLRDGFRNLEMDETFFVERSTGMPATTQLVVCSLRSNDGGGQVIVPPDTCEQLGGTSKGEPTTSQAVDWRTTTLRTLTGLLTEERAGTPLSEERRAVYEHVLSQLR